MADTKTSISEGMTWTEVAAEIYQTSTTYIDANYRRQWEDGIRHFSNQHHSGSKYNTADFRYRSKMFRPKSRAVVRNNEAAASTFLAAPDAIEFEPEDPLNKAQRALGDLMAELVPYRLKNTIPWFLISMGAFQDAQKVGVVASYQGWAYDARIQKFEMQGTDDFGQPVDAIVEKEVLIKDSPYIKLIPVENIRIHPNADWYDPVNSSPFLIILWPMYVRDVKERMNRVVDKGTGATKWKKLTDGEIESAMRHTYDATKMTRDKGREDPAQVAMPGKLKEYDVVWVHENILRRDGADMVFFTLGTQHMLTDPEPIEERYPTGDRPVVMGISVIDSHRLFPEGTMGLGRNLQIELNEIANQRLDNVKLVLNKRWFVRRGSQVDLKSITRNVAGSVTLVEDVEADVKEVNFPDVTASSYMEQDRLNADFDELTGNFSTSSVMTNRRMNETVGGMQMIRQPATAISEYTLKTFSETWIEPVIRQIVKLEQFYETDTQLIQLAANRAMLPVKYGINQVTPEFLQQRLLITVNVGFGSTDPMMRLQHLLFACDKYTQISVSQQQLPIPTLNVEEVGRELFMRIGYKSGNRFVFQGAQPGMAQIQQKMQEMAQVIQQLQAQLQDKERDRQVKLIERQMTEDNLNKRKIAELETRMEEKKLDLANPVVGEKPQKNAAAGQQG